MQQNGIVFVIVVLDGKKRNRFSRVFAPGVLDIERDKQFISTIISFISSTFGNKNQKFQCRK